MENLNERLQRPTVPKKLLCRLRLCFAKKKLYHGPAVFENEAKKNHAPEQVWGIYHFNECEDCGRVAVALNGWTVLNEATAKLDQPPSPL